MVLVRQPNSSPKKPCALAALLDTYSNQTKRPSEIAMGSLLVCAWGWVSPGGRTRRGRIDSDRQRSTSALETIDAPGAPRVASQKPASDFMEIATPGAHESAPASKARATALRACRASAAQRRGLTGRYE